MKFTCRFQRTLDRTFFKICFVQIVSAAGGSCVALFIDIMVRKCLPRTLETSSLTLFLQFVGFYLPANALLLVFLFQITSFCALGTIVELAVNANFYLLSSVPKLYSYIFRMIAFTDRSSHANGIYCGQRNSECSDIYCKIVKNHVLCRWAALLI